MKAKESNKLINYNYKNVGVAKPKKHQWEGCACFFLARSEILGAVYKSTTQIIFCSESTPVLRFDNQQAWKACSQE